MYLYHFFDKSTGPFQNISDLSVDDAKAVLNGIKQTSRIPNVLKGMINMLNTGVIVKI